jgi:hypothetical protein
MTTWNALAATLNTATVKNPLIGARELVVETDVWPYPIVGLLDTVRWRDDTINQAPVRMCDAHARFLSSEFAATDAQEGARVLDGDHIYIILSVEMDDTGLTHCLLRKFVE